MTYIVQLFGVGNDKQNLGNSLYISDRYIRDLDTDINQTSPEPSFLINTVNTKEVTKTVVWIHFQGRPKNNASLEKIFNQASDMVHNVFAEKAIEMDLLTGISKEDFSVDAIVDPSTGEVLSAIEYVYMRKYVWVECFAVKQNCQNSGIGKLMMERLIQIAAFRRKDILLYSLLDVLAFYKNYGFQICPKCFVD
jgi:GNAT superfamily N-acetyltransferase